MNSDDDFPDIYVKALEAARREAALERRATYIGRLMAFVSMVTMAVSGGTTDLPGLAWVCWILATFYAVALVPLFSVLAGGVRPGQLRR